MDLQRGPLSRCSRRGRRICKASEPEERRWICKLERRGSRRRIWKAGGVPWPVVERSFLCWFLRGAVARRRWEAWSGKHWLLGGRSGVAAIGGSVSEVDESAQSLRVEGCPFTASRSNICCAAQPFRLIPLAQVLSAAVEDTS